MNVPLRDGITDESYQSIFVPIMTQVMERFQPNAVVLQCGADSLVGDRLGTFNLTLKGKHKFLLFDPKIIDSFRTWRVRQIFSKSKRSVDVVGRWRIHTA